MTLYVSKTPRDLNHDPEPWQVYAQGVPSWRRNHHRDRFENGFGEIVIDRHVPRPEFDHVQHNEPSQVLVGFRRWSERFTHCTVPELARIELINMKHGSGIFQGDATDEEIVHARRVLERLARL